MCTSENSNGWTIGSFPYSMYLVLNEYFDGYEPLEHFTRIVKNFGKKLGKEALVAVPMKGSYGTLRRDVLGLAWEPRIGQELERIKYPYILVTRKPLAYFVPDQDEYIIMRFPEATYDSNEILKYVEVLDEIATEINKGADIFEWRHAKARKRIAGKMLGRLYEAVEAKPGIYGFSIDLKKLITG